ncbi:MAG: nucleotide exchange factor GrpE [Opitutales bacterium]|jgi:molecular chaperone GrpE|nr:nucleotide exchange factor GrpE [Opitutales bacterium]MDG2169659.1 nucleotide exchange factor GrpE [Opitutales bacterium]
MKAEEKNQTSENEIEEPVVEEAQEATENTAEAEAPQKDVAEATGEEASTDEEAVEEEKELTVDELLQQSHKEKEDLYQKVLRAAADFENFRKRSLREKEELRKYAVSGLIEDLLPALDNLELGLAAADNHQEAKAVSDGFRMVAQQITSILQNNGVECLNPEGEEFDPNFHESVGFQPSDEVEDQKVIQVLRKGYSLNGRILRAANVIVSSGPASEEEGES